MHACEVFMSTIQSQSAAEQVNAASSKKSDFLDKLKSRNEKHGDMFASVLSGWRKANFQGNERVREGKMAIMQSKFKGGNALMSNLDAKQRQKDIEQDEMRKEEDEKKLERKRREQDRLRKEEIAKEQELKQEDAASMALNMNATNPAGTPFSRLVSALASSGSNTGYEGSNLSQQATATNLVANTENKVNGFAVAEANSSGAQAAVKMASVSDSSVQVEKELNEINQRNLSSVPENQEPSVSEKIAKMDNNELRQNLDRLAKDSSVSKLSLHMSNPQTQAQNQSNAAAIANLPTSPDKLASLGASTNTNGSGAANIQSTQASTEDVLRYRQVMQTQEPAKSSRAQELLQKTDASQAIASRQTLAKASHTSANSTVQNGVSTGSRASVLASAAHQTTTEKASSAQLLATSNTRSLGNESLVKETAQQGLLMSNVQSGTFASKSAGSTLVSPNFNSASGTFTNGLGASGTALLASVSKFNSQSAFANTSALTSSGLDDSILSDNLTKSSLASLSTAGQSAAMRQALDSLKQGMGMQPVYSQGYDPRNYAGNLSANALQEASNAEQQDLDSSLAEDEQNAASTTASASVSASAQAASAFAQVMQGSENAEMLASMPLSASAAENAKELHEKVMQMAARNLKQLSVDLTPNNMGRMRIEISLDKENEALAVSLAAVSPQTRAALKQALPQLREALATQNIIADETIYQLEDQTSVKQDSIFTTNGQMQTSEEFFAQRRMSGVDQA